jgi:hypothetical protein
MSYRAPNSSEIIAAAVLQILRLRGDPIDPDHARQMTPRQIRSLVQIDHYPVRRETASALGWGADQVNHPANLDLKLILAHRRKSAKVDMPQIKHGRKVTEAQEEHRRRMLAKHEGEPPVRSSGRWPKQKVPGSKGTPWKKKMNGRAVRRGSVG